MHFPRPMRAQLGPQKEGRRHQKKLTTNQSFHLRGRAQPVLAGSRQRLNLGENKNSRVRDLGCTGLHRAQNDSWKRFSSIELEMVPDCFG